MNLKKFEWIFFDIGGVLTDESKSNKLRMQTVLEIINQYVPDVFMEDIIDEYWTGASSAVGDVDKSLLRIFLKKEDLIEQALGQLAEKKKFWPAYHERNVIRNESGRTLEALSKNHKIGVIANQSGLVRDFLEKGGILKYFDFLGISAEYKLEKPDPAFFEEVLKDSGADPSKSVMIDDNIKRGLLPAKKLGFTTIWFNFDRRNGKGETDYEINSLEELI